MMYRPDGYPLAWLGWWVGVLGLTSNNPFNICAKLASVCDQQLGHWVILSYSDSPLSLNLTSVPFTTF